MVCTYCGTGEQIRNTCPIQHEDSFNRNLTKCREGEEKEIKNEVNHMWWRRTEVYQYTARYRLSWGVIRCCWGCRWRLVTVSEGEEVGKRNGEMKGRRKLSFF